MSLQPLLRQVRTFIFVVFVGEPSPVCAPQVHNSWIGLSMFLPASHADGLGTCSKVKRPQAVHPIKKDQYITVLFLQKLKMSTRICTGRELCTGDHWSRRERLKVRRGPEAPGSPPHPAHFLRNIHTPAPFPGSWLPLPLRGSV